MKWYRTLTSSASGAGCEHLSKSSSETDKPLHTYLILVFLGEDQTDANQVIFQHGIYAFFTWDRVLRGMLFYDIHAIFKNKDFGNLKAPMRKRYKHGKG